MREEKLLDLRPNLNLETEDSSDIEAFQNNTLRPLLKFQHELTLSMLNHSTHFIKMKEKIDQDDLKLYTETVLKYVGTNIVFKNKMIGAIVGLMTLKEFSFYSENQAELNKRILSMQVQRYVDSKNL